MWLMNTKLDHGDEVIHKHTSKPIRIQTIMNPFFTKKDRLITLLPFLLWEASWTDDAAGWSLCLGEESEASLNPYKTNT